MNPPAPPYERDDDGEPTVLQPSINGWTVTWNPDWDKFCVHADDVRSQVVSVQHYWKNIVQWCNTHKDHGYRPKKLCVNRQVRTSTR